MRAIKSATVALVNQLNEEGFVELIGLEDKGRVISLLFAYPYL